MHRLRSLVPSPWSGMGFCGAFFVFAALATGTFLADSLMGLYLGRYIVAEGIPHVDTLTIAGAGRDWLDQQWLAQLAYYGAWYLGGNAAVGLLSAVANATAFGLLTGALRRRGVPDLQAIAWTGVALVVCLNNTFIRAQSFALPIFTLVIILLLGDSERSRYSARRWLAILALLVLWANVHGSLLLMLPVLLAYAALRAFACLRRGRHGDGARYAVTCVLLPATLLATPYGWNIVHYYRSIFGNEAIATYISEWLPADPTSRESLPFLAFLAIAIAVVSFQWGKGQRPPTLLLGMTVWFGLIGTQALRYHLWVAVPGVLLLASVARLPTDSSPGGARRARRLLAPPAIAMGLATIGIVVSYAVRSEQSFYTAVPTQEVSVAARYMERHPTTTILADDPSAPALIWLHPDAVVGRIGFDARLEMYRERDIRGYFRFVSATGPDWLDATEGYDLLLVSNLFHPATVDALRRLDGWRVLTSSDDGILLAREGGAS